MDKSMLGGLAVPREGWYVLRKAHLRALARPVR